MTLIHFGYLKKMPFPVSLRAEDPRKSRPKGQSTPIRMAKTSTNTYPQRASKITTWHPLSTTYGIIINMTKAIEIFNYICIFLISQSTRNLNLAISPSLSELI